MIYYKATEHKVEMQTKSAKMAELYKLSLTCEEDGLETAWDGSVWEKGYAPAEPEEHKKGIRREQIIKEMTELDLKAIRSLRAKAAGTATEEDNIILAEIESKMAQKREELKNL